MSKLRELSRRMEPMALNALKLLGVLLAIALGLYVAVKLASLILPFLIAYVIASMVEPLVRVLNKRLRFSRSIASIVSVLLVVALLVGGLTLVTIKLAGEARDFAMKLPGMYNDWAKAANDAIAGLDGRYDFIDENVIKVVNDTLGRVQGELMGLVNALTRGVWTALTSTPRLIVTLIVTILATFFLVRDRDVIGREMDRQLPKRWMSRVAAVRDDLFGALFGYLRALLILMLVTFIELSIGFALVGVNYAILFALIIAVLDALPVLGSGSFIVPWAIYNLIAGEIQTAVGLLLVFIVVWVVRQLLEPRVVGDQIGIHPLLTLLSMYIGLQYLGVFGMIVGPITLIIVRNLINVYTNGHTLKEMIYQGIDMPEDELSPTPDAAGVRRKKRLAHASVIARAFRSKHK